ncbi:MAG TPA: MFS transporter [Planctomycetota bacterium]|nr:MFS transporter [Planctomycetota bacterium]
MNLMESVRTRLAPLTSAFRALRYRNYRLFFFGQGVSLIGTWMQSTALSWLVYRMTGSKALLGIVAFASMFPMFVLTPLAGVFSDRVNRRNILVVTQTLAMLQAFVLAALVFTGVIAVWHIVVLGVFLGLCIAFDMPTRHAFVVEMVERRDDLSNAIALNSLVFNTARFIAPGLAGMLIYACPNEGPLFVINGVTFLAVIVAYFAMRLPGKPRRRRGGRILGELMEGVTYVWRCPPMRAVLVLISVVSLGGMPYVTLMPVFARDVLGGDARTFGWLLTASGLGAVAGAAFLASRKDVSAFPWIIPWATATLGASLVAFSLSTHFWVSATFIAVVGFSLMIEIAASNTVVQTMVADDKRGRVMGLFALSFLGIAPFGHFIAGMVAERVGAPVTLLGGGVACLIGAAGFLPAVAGVRKLACPVCPEKGVPEEIAEGMRAASIGPAPDEVDEG